MSSSAAATPQRQSLRSARARGSNPVARPKPSTPAATATESATSPLSSDRDSISSASSPGKTVQQNPISPIASAVIVRDRRPSSAFGEPIGLTSPTVSSPKSATSSSESSELSAISSADSDSTVESKQHALKPPMSPASPLSQSIYASQFQQPAISPRSSSRSSTPGSDSATSTASASNSGINSTPASPPAGVVGTRSISSSNARRRPVSYMINSHNGNGANDSKDLRDLLMKSAADKRSSWAVTSNLAFDLPPTLANTESSHSPTTATATDADTATTATTATITTSVIESPEPSTSVEPNEHVESITVPETSIIDTTPELGDHHSATEIKDAENDSETALVVDVALPTSPLMVTSRASIGEAAKTPITAVDSKVDVTQSPNLKALPSPLVMDDIEPADTIEELKRTVEPQPQPEPEPELESESESEPVEVVESVHSEESEESEEFVESVDSEVADAVEEVESTKSNIDEATDGEDARNSISSVVSNSSSSSSDSVNEVDDFLDAITASEPEPEPKQVPESKPVEAKIDGVLRPIESDIDMLRDHAEQLFAASVHSAPSFDQVNITSEDLDREYQPSIMSNSSMINHHDPADPTSYIGDMPTPSSSFQRTRKESADLHENDDSDNSFDDAMSPPPSSVASASTTTATPSDAFIVTPKMSTSSSASPQATVVHPELFLNAAITPTTTIPESSIHIDNQQTADFSNVSIDDEAVSPIDRAILERDLPPVPSAKEEFVLPYDAFIQPPPPLAHPPAAPVEVLSPSIHSRSLAIGASSPPMMAKSSTFVGYSDDESHGDDYQYNHGDSDETDDDSTAASSTAAPSPASSVMSSMVGRFSSFFRPHSAAATPATAPALPSADQSTDSLLFSPVRTTFQTPTVSRSLGSSDAAATAAQTESPAIPPQARSVGHKPSPSTSSISSLSSGFFSSFGLSLGRRQSTAANTSANMPPASRSPSFASVINESIAPAAACSAEFMQRRLELHNSALAQTGGASPNPFEYREQMRVSLDKIHAKSIVDGSEKTVNWPLWELVITDVDSAVKKHGQAIAATILETGVPVIIRGIVWQCLAKSMDMSLATRFGELAAQRQPRIEQAIIADIQAHRLAEIRGVNIDAVVSVLTAYFAYDSHCDYVPGLASITAVLTLHLNPVDAFCLLVRLMVTYDLRSHLHPRSEKTQLRLHQFDRLLEESLPLVQRHFIQEGIPSSAFVPGWFAALFATHLPLPAAARIVDIILAEGIEGLFRFALTLLRVNQQRVFSHSFDNLRAFITGPEIFDVYTSASPPVDILQFIVDSTTQQSNLITVSRLDSLSAEFDLRRAREQQEQTQLEQLKLINAQLDQANKKLQSNLQQLNQEHCDLANQLVQIRLELIREREVSTKYQQRTTDLEQQVLVEREKAEESMRNDMDALAHRNIELAEKAMKLEGDMIDVQDALISVKLKYAESEQMREDLNRRFKELRRALGHN